MNLACHLGNGVRICFLNGEFKQNARFFQLFFKGVKRIDPVAEKCSLFEERRCGIRVIPEPVTGAKC